MRRRLCAAALALLWGTGCPVAQPVGDAWRADRYGAIPRGTALPCLTNFEERHTAPLNPAVIEWIFMHPSMPFVRGITHPDQRDNLRGIAQGLAPTMNEHLAAGLCTTVWGPGSYVSWYVDGKARVVEIAWRPDGRPTDGGAGLPHIRMLFDLSKLPDAFDPERPLTSAEIATAVAWTGDSQ